VDGNRFASPVRGGFSGRGRGGRSDPLVAKTVNIIKGMWKGYLGIIKDATDTHCRVELHTNNRTVTVPKDDVAMSGSGGLSRGPTYSNTFGSRNTSLFDGGKTPAYESGHGAATPNPYTAAGSRTPAWDAGSKTPAWDAGSKTPAWDAGSKTPAWDAGSKTPAWDSGSRTPAWGATARTPGTEYANPYTPGSGATPYQQ
jgi:transcription elongation factor SPT5